MLFCFRTICEHTTQRASRLVWFVWREKRVCVYHQPTATSTQGFNLSLMSAEVTHAAVSRLIFISEAENAFLDPGNTFEQRPLSGRAAE